MLTLTSTLQAAMRRADRVPVLSAIVCDRPCEHPRWSFTPIYGPSGSDGCHAIVRLFSGYLVRARQTPTGAIETQLITNPAVAAQWNVWTATKAAGTTSLIAGLALASDTTLALLRLFYVDAADDRTIRCAQSTDGVAWVEETVYVESAGPPALVVRGLAADMTGGDGHLIYSLSLQTGAPDEVLVALERVGGVWVNRVQHGEMRAETHGICAAHDAALHLIFIGVADADPDGGRRIAFQELNATTNAFAGGAVLAKHGAGSGFDFARPRLRLASADYPRHTYTWVESSGVVDRPMIASTPIRYWLTEWIPRPDDAAFGVQLLLASGVWYLVGADRAWRATAYSAAVGERLDISADVMSLRVDTESPMRPTRATIVLANDRGGYDLAGQSGPALCLRPGAQVAIRLGFRTTAGSEPIAQPPVWIVSVRHLFDGTRATVEVECADVWGVLDRLRTGLTIQFPTATTIGHVLNRAFWRVTGATVSGGSGLSAALTNAVWAPDRAYGEIARRLCRLAGLIARFRTEASAVDGAGPDSVTPSLLNPVGRSVTYGYGTDHPIAALRVSSTIPLANHVTMQGARGGGYWAEAHDEDSIAAIGWRLSQPVVDLRLNSQTDTQQAADAALAEIERDDASTWIDVPLNPAQEIGDTIALTHARAGLNAAERIVTGMQVRWSRTPAREATMRLRCG